MSNDTTNALLDKLAVTPTPREVAELLSAVEPIPSMALTLRRLIFQRDLLQARIVTLFKDIPGLHQRKCHACTMVHWHAQDRTPGVLCPECGSQDTRRVKP